MYGCPRASLHGHQDTEGEIVTRQDILGQDQLDRYTVVLICEMQKSIISKIDFNQYCLSVHEKRKSHEFAVCFKRFSRKRYLNVN